MSKKIHLISIGGAVMHNMALALHNQGHRVSGSDDEIFEPSKTRLANKGLLPAQMGWNEANITSDLDFVILGMHAKKDNPELLKAKELGITVYSFPEYVYEQSKDKKRVVIAGSHGKTTTTAIIMHALQHAQMPFDYLVGSQLSGFDTMVSLSDAPVIIIEGDEYLTSPIDLKPKFHWYKANIALITGIAWDHINVFPTFENYVEQFAIFIDDIDKNGALFWFEQDEELQQLIKNAPCKNMAYDTPVFKLENGQICWMEEEEEFPLQVFGKHNLQNMLGAQLVCEQLGITKAEFLRAMASFKGTARRLEPINTTKFAAAFRDFAHAPSKVTATVNAVCEQYKANQIIAVLELHTYSSLRLDFLPHYANSLDGAASKIIYLNPHVFEMKNMPVIPDTAIYETFGSDTIIVANKEGLAAKIEALQQTNNVLLLMSSGNFDGLDFAPLL
jgi:UDP-N-acetylmuramate: L-alanyl-gamma-D-glutamyl-meso-diaminopimelate ligase